MAYETVRRILARQFDIAESDISENTDIVKDLGADSLDLAELLASLEESFGLLFTDDRIRELYTVGEVSAFIESLRKAD